MARSTARTAAENELLIRWAAKFDIPAILDIDAASDDPWCWHYLEKLLRRRESMLVVAETSRREIVGVRGISFFDYEIGLEYLAVHPDYRRRGIATALLRNLEDKVQRHRQRRSIFMTAPACSLSLHKTLAACGYVAHWIDHEDDHIYFEWTPYTEV